MNRVGWRVAFWIFGYLLVVIAIQQFLTVFDPVEALVEIAIAAALAWFVGRLAARRSERHSERGST